MNPATPPVGATGRRGGAPGRVSTSDGWPALAHATRSCPGWNTAQKSVTNMSCGFWRASASLTWKTISSGSR
jgi:hypothetical protein